MMKNIENIIPEVDKLALYTWTDVANNELIRSIVINNIGNDDPQPCNYSTKFLNCLLLLNHFSPNNQAPPQHPPPNSPSSHHSSLSQA